MVSRIIDSYYILILSSLRNIIRLRKKLLQKSAKHILYPRKSFKYGKRSHKILTPILLENIESNLGMRREDFYLLLERVKDQIDLPRKIGAKKRICSLATPLRLYIMLYFNRKYLHYTSLGQIFHVSGSTISRDLRHVLPIIKSQLNNIKFPETFPNKVMGAVGAIDCSAHPKNRSSPQYFYFNGFKGYHCLYSQVTVGLDGKLYHLYIANGKNNDLGLLRDSGLKHVLLEKKIKLFGDPGYRNNDYIRAVMRNPYQDPLISYANQIVSRHRAVVENVFGHLKNYQSCLIRNRHAVPIHMAMLRISFELVAKTILDSPLRSNEFFSQI